MGTEMVNVNERSRVYHLCDGRTIRFSNVVRIGVSPRGTHRVETAGGRKHFVRGGVWDYITLDCDDWSV